MLRQILPYFTVFYYFALIPFHENWASGCCPPTYNKKNKSNRTKEVSIKVVNKILTLRVTLLWPNNTPTRITTTIARVAVQSFGFYCEVFLAGIIAVFCPLCLSSLWRNGSSLRFPRSFSSENKGEPRGDLAINWSILEDTGGKKRGKVATTRGKKCPGFAWEATQEQMSSHPLFYDIVGICSKEDTFLHHPLLSTTSSLSILLRVSSDWTCLQPLSRLVIPPPRVRCCFVGIELRTCLRPKIVSFY